MPNPPPTLVVLKAYIRMLKGIKKHPYTECRRQNPARKRLGIDQHSKEHKGNHGQLQKIKHVHA